jgi:hypothetical protein
MCTESDILFYSKFACAWLVQDIISNGMLLKYVHYVTTYSKYKYMQSFIHLFHPFDNSVYRIQPTFLIFSFYNSV